ncbi:hypothetical protein E3N88_27568 [Mikania micrantha]|uniref:Uncharacterized protein n=1 Tax=Mikania micrantha TaxID=192012 RepID=A0A5N6MY61_9ASTR|nr:hypothetical protein E3N88_27568 [Mikania micrantha]
METVGKNVKNFFSAFVDEMAPTQVVDPVQYEAQLVPSMGINLAEPSASSVVEIIENPIDNISNIPKDAPLVPKELCQRPSSTGLRHSEQFTTETSQCLIGEEGTPTNNTSDNATQANLNSSTKILNIDYISEEKGVLYDESYSDVTANEYSDWGIENILNLDLDIDNMINLEENKTLLNEPAECDSNTLATHQASEFESSVTCNENQEEHAKHIIGSGLSSERFYESLNSSFQNSTVEPDAIDCNPTETVDDLSISSDILSSYGSFTTLSFDSNNETSVSCPGSGIADGSTVNIEDFQKDAVESCVIVEGEKLSVFPITSRSKSYKKMIQDAFLSRKRLTKEYRQLAVWYGDIDKELCQPTEGSSKPPAQDLPDSEWELL